MSSIKSQESKLSAIYSLDFYKKQNSWNLSSSLKAMKPPQKPAEIKQNLNVIENQEPEEQSDPHNTAFVATDSDKKNNEPSQDWPESWDPSAVKEQNAQSTLDPINDYCEKRSHSQCVTQLGTPKTRTLKRLQELQKAILDFKEKTNAEDRPESLELEDASVKRNVGNEDCFWVSPTDVIDGLHYPEDPEDVVSPADWPHGLFGDMTWNEAEEAEDWSVDSEGEFMRGAHAAPHSSETELELPPELTTSDVSSSSLCRLSSLQLVQAVQQHSLLLQKLLQEREHRQKLRIATLNGSYGSSIEDFLSWDLGPYNLGCGNTLTRNTFYKDVFITGSYKNVDTLQTRTPRGRGRGRWVNN